MEVQRAAIPWLTGRQMPVSGSHREPVTVHQVGQATWEQPAQEEAAAIVLETEAYRQARAVAPEEALLVALPAAVAAHARAVLAAHPVWEAHAVRVAAAGGGSQ
jgi:hypothetical protein